MGRKWPAVLIIIVLVLVAFRIALPFAAKGYINHKLNSLPGMRGHVETVHLHIIRGFATLGDLKVSKVVANGEYPLFQADEAIAAVHWGPLLHKEVVADVRLEHPILNYDKLATLPAAPRGPPPQPPSQPPPPPGTKPTPKVDIQAKLREAIPFRINTFQVRNGEFHYRDLTTQPKTQVYASKIDIDIENITNSKKLSDTLFSTLDMKALVMDSGRAHITGKFNPIKEPPEFKVSVELYNLDIAKLNPVLTAKKDIQIQKGHLDLFSEVASKNNNVDGYVKPLIRDLQVSNLKKDIKKGLGHAIKEQALNVAGDILKNQPEDQQAARVPFHGTIQDPKAGVGPAIASTLQNIFVKALTPNLEHSVSIAQAGHQKNKGK